VKHPRNVQAAVLAVTEDAGLQGEDALFAAVISEIGAGI